MGTPQNPDEGMVMAQVVIMRTLQPDGTDVVSYIASDADGLVIPIIETLGMIELAKDGLLHRRPEEEDEDVDDAEVPGA
jgi:hypothetical protein